MFQVANMQKIGSGGLVYYIFRTKKEDINEVHIYIYFYINFIDLFNPMNNVTFKIKNYLVEVLRKFPDVVCIMQSIVTLRRP